MSTCKTASVIDTDPTVVLDPRGFDHETALVAQLHAKFDLGLRRTPDPQGKQPWEERVTCMQEELTEFKWAAEAGDLPGMADALVDLVVFAKGTAVQLGLPWAHLFDDVMRANLSKVRGVGKRGHAVDLVKPPGWQGPKTVEILRRHGWLPPPPPFNEEDEK